MIEARELRIGNYLQPKEKAMKELWEQEMDIKPKSFGEVTSIDNDEIRLYIDSMEIEFYYEDIQPIPLTEEWLLKFGFKQNSFSLNFENDTRISIYKENNCFIAQIDNTVIKEIKYVHEWQNLYFDFTDEELTLNK